MLWTQTPNHSALRRETFLALLRRKESPSSSLILLRVVQASRAKTMTGTLAQVWVWLKIDDTFTTHTVPTFLFRCRFLPRCHSSKVCPTLQHAHTHPI